MREFDVADISPFTINFGWERDGAPFTQAIFSKGEKFPCSKMVSLTRGQAFDITASYRWEGHTYTSCVGNKRNCVVSARK